MAVNAVEQLKRETVKPVSHRAYGLYGQACTVNAYGHPKICPRYGLVRSARTVSTVNSYGLYGHARSPVQPVRLPVRSLRSIVRSLRSVATVSTVTYGQTISPTSSLFVAQRSSTYTQGNMEKFWGD